MTDRQPGHPVVPGSRKEFGAVKAHLTAVDHVDLEIAAGEFFSMLGPSGSGKTTVLRLIAGFEQPTAGTIELFGQDVTEARALRPRRQHGVPGLRAVSAHERDRQRRLRAAGRGIGARERHARAEALARCASSTWPPQARRSCRAVSGSASRWRAPRSSAQGPAARRAARRTGSQAARADAGRAQADPARPRHHLHLRHARPGGGAHPLRPHRRVQRRAHRAARHAARALRAAGLALRRRLRRHLEPLRRRPLAASSSAARASHTLPPGEADLSTHDGLEGEGVAIVRRARSSRSIYLGSGVASRRRPR